jgi:hypothetical protein
MTIPLHERAEAHGKVIVCGEHAVVYGYPAVAAGLPQGLVLSAAPLRHRADPITLTIPAWGLDLELTAASEHPVARACLEVLAHCDGPLTGWAIRGDTRLPARAGLGSSAALTVALALGGGALLSRAKHRWAEVSWRSFSSPAAGFAIDLPGAPEQQEQTTPSPAGPIAIRMFNAHAGNGGVASCIVQTFTQPEGYTWSLDESAAALAQYLRTNHGVTVAPPRPATLGGLDAMEVSADFPRDERLRTWVAVDERVKFHVTVTGDRGDVRLQRCADSFRRLR